MAYSACALQHTPVLSAGYPIVFPLCVRLPSLVRWHLHSGRLPEKKRHTSLVLILWKRCEGETSLYFTSAGKVNSSTWVARKTITVRFIPVGAIILGWPCNSILRHIGESQHHWNRNCSCGLFFLPKFNVFTFSLCARLCCIDYDIKIFLNECNGNVCKLFTLRFVRLSKMRCSFRARFTFASVLPEFMQVPCSKESCYPRLRSHSYSQSSRTCSRLIQFSFLFVNL